MKPKRPTYVAHSRGASGKRQPLQEHLRAVAAAAARNGEAIGAAEIARRAGLLHDIGKYSAEWQRWLNARETAPATTPKHGPDHKRAGLRMACEIGGWVGEAIGWVIHGHHDELPKHATIRQAVRDSRGEKVVDEAIARALAEMPELAESLPEADGIPAPARGAATNAEMFIRLLYSCLIDADHTDTGIHFRGDRLPAVETSPAELLGRLLVDQKHLRRKVRREAKEHPERDPRVNAVRREIWKACLAAAEGAPGVYLLPAATGSGKTRSALGFALKHAVCRPAARGSRRVIYTAPYTSIIDQTAEVYQDILGREPVLVHHSAVPEPRSREGWEQERWRVQAAENWDAPVVVTTMVQLFDSLFSNTPYRCRKLHRIAQSVIILDEVQTLPVTLLEPLLSVLRVLVEHYGVTLLMMTATMPALVGETRYLHGLPHAHNILDGLEAVTPVPRRVRYELQGRWSWSRVADEVRGADQVLVVVNTRRDAMALMDALEPKLAAGASAGDCNRDVEPMHLSTLLCPAHRRVVLEEIKNRLERGRPCRLVSTQVIEAGVHVDFPRALRAMAGMDRIIQTAGRCNREGELRDGDGNLVAGRVIVFTPETEILPSGSYVTATWLTRNKLWAGADPHDPEAVREYFQELYVGVCTDAKGIQRLRAKMNFPKVAAKARLIDEDTVPVIVPYDRAAYDRLLAQLSDGPPMRDWWRAAQEHSVSLFPADLAAGLASGQVEEIVPDQVYAWRGEYHLTRGVAGVLRGVEDAEDKDDAKL